MTSHDNVEDEPTRSRQPKRLVLSFLGEFIVQDWDKSVRTGVFLEVLHGAGVAAPAARATLDRLVRGGVLTRERHGRHLEFSLTPTGRSMLGEATDRVRGPSPFHPNGDGWTLVTFSLPEELRTLRGGCAPRSPGTASLLCATACGWHRGALRWRQRSSRYGQNSRTVR